MSLLNFFLKMIASLDGGEHSYFDIVNATDEQLNEWREEERKNFKQDTTEAIKRENRLKMYDDELRKRYNTKHNTDSSTKRIHREHGFNLYKED